MVVLAFITVVSVYLSAETFRENLSQPASHGSSEGAAEGGGKREAA